ncbi:MAG: hypothetical protein HeimC3_07400 [Candidatus Heimdallarchaeota archaeon LC_3]|nr:MAG: hypothetical protein HeimC3_07400 [Candidatus Heimdallarchaeota archaeon LC_3]
MDIKENLLIYLTEKYPDSTNINIEITSKITSGWETEIYCFTLKTDNTLIFPYEDLVIRIYPSFNEKKRTHNEFKVMCWLRDKNYPVPDVLLLEIEDNPFNRPFIIMQEIEGKTLRQILESASEEGMPYYLNKFSETFVDLHNLDLSDFPCSELGLPKITVSNFFEMYSLLMEERLKANNLEKLLPILDWIKKGSSQVKVDRISVIHGDFHPDNILVDNNGKFIVLDWSASMPVDFRYDLAWTMVLTRIYSNEQLKDMFFSSYESVLGNSVHNIKLFEVIALLRRLSDIAIILSRGSSVAGLREDTTYIIKSEKELITKLQDLLFKYTKIKIEIPVE